MGARGSMRVHTLLAKLTRLADKGARESLWCMHGCPELTGVREGAWWCIRGCAELTGVGEEACGCMHGCAEPAGVRE
eukprot:915675-Pyramimonas_sp.AAC.1